MLALLCARPASSEEVAHSEPVPAAASPEVSSTPNWLEDSEVQSCLSLRKIPDGVWAKTSGIKVFRCTGNPPRSFQSPYAYSIRTMNGQIEIKLKVELHYGHYGTQQSQWLEAYRQSSVLEQCVEEFYKRNGINLRLETLTKTGPKTQTNSGYIPVEMVDDVLTNNATNWNAFLPRAILDGQKFACGGVVHEVGHLLGLEDGYRADYCPNRKITPKDDIMNDSSIESRLYPYAIREFVQPLCGRTKPTVSAAPPRRKQRRSYPVVMPAVFRTFN